MSGHRVGRVSEDIKREITALLRELKDPRIKGMLSVVRVDVSNDLSYAKVYVSAIEGIETAKESVKGLKSAGGYLRKRIADALRLRKAPELIFIADDSIEYGAGISRILSDILPDSSNAGGEDDDGQDSAGD